MKRILLCAAAMAAMTACSDAAVEALAPEVVEEAKMVTITASSAATRAAVQNDWSSLWETGDALLAVDESGSQTNKFALQGAGGTINGEFTGEAMANNFKLLYPYSLVAAKSTDDNFNLDLTSQVAGLRGNYMISENTLANGTLTANATMLHLTSAVVLNFELGAGYDGATIESVVVRGLNSKGVLDVTDGSVSGASQSPIAIDGCGAVFNAGGDATIKFNILPTAVVAGGKIDINLYLKKADDTKEALSKSLESAAAFNFNVGEYHAVTCASMVAASGLWTDSGNFSEDAFVGTGEDAENAYQISTAAQLAKIANDVNSGTNEYEGKFFKLTQDIDLSAHEWVAIGGVFEDDNRNFKGTFDGDNHQITGLFVNELDRFKYAGLFGKVVDATIKNLSVSGSVRGAKNSNLEVGGIVACTSGNCTIDNCHNSCSVEGFGANVGGVIGCGEVTNCSNSGSVKGVNYVGGISGYANANITNCSNSGSVEGSENVGGIVGCVESIGNITNCSNSGSVEGSENVGGIVGYIFQGTGDITNCYNSGLVEGTSDVAGIVGKAGNSGKINNCYNLGSISGLSYVAGVVGKPFTAIHNCYNSGSVEGSSDYVGGIAGKATKEIANCYNDGSIKGGNCVGGVGGAVSNYAPYNCYNSGSVEGSGGNVSGLFGENEGAASYCYYLDTTLADAKATPKTATDMQSLDFLNELNGYAATYNGTSDDYVCEWIAGNGGYPTLNFGVYQHLTED